MAQFLWTSFLASVVLTIVANVLFRLVPGLSDRAGRWLASQTARTGVRGPQPDPPTGDPAPAAPPTGEGAQPRVQVHVPWKAMLIGSLLLTLLLNLPRLL